MTTRAEMVNGCPSCGASLDDSGEIWRCPNGCELMPRITSQRAEAEKRVEHTPGPWRVMDYWGHDMCRVGTKGGHRPLFDIYGGGVEEVRANARLIAAAPDLKAAAKEAEDFISNLYAFTAEEPPEALRLLRAAINKAEGREAGS